MFRSDVAKELKKATGGQAFITATDLAKAFGCSDTRKIKNKYLKDLTAVDGKYYLIKEVAETLCARQRADRD